MKKLILISIFFLSLFQYAACYAKPAEQEIDQIIAIVNDDIITKSELNRAFKIAKLQLNQSQLTPATEKRLQKQMLDQIINRKLQLQLANQDGIKISDRDLESAIEKVAEENHVSISELYSHINREGMSTEFYRNEMRDQLTLRKLQQQEVASRIMITPQEIDHFLASKAWKNNEANEYRLNDIVIPLSDAPSSQEIISARKRAQTIIDKMNEGQTFRDIAKAESAAQRALEGGDLGWRKLPEIPSAFAEHIAHMKAKEIAGPIQTANGFHIIRLDAVRALSSNQNTPSRKQVEDLLLDKKFDEAVQNWMSKLRNQAYIVNKLEG